MGIDEVNQRDFNGNLQILIAQANAHFISIVAAV